MKPGRTTARSKGPPTTPLRRPASKDNGMAFLLIDGHLLLALENILDIPRAMKYTDNFNRTHDYSIENNVSTNGKTLNPGSQLISVTPQAGLTVQQFHRLVDLVDKTVRIRFAVISNVTSNLE
jgi:adenine-specific DNA methylase